MSSLSNFFNRSFGDTATFFGCLVGFSIPFERRVFSITALLFLIHWLLEGRFKWKWQQIRSQRYSLLLFVSYFGLLLIGMLYTENRHVGHFELQKHLSMLIIPVLLSSSTMGNYKAVLKAFVWGSIAASFYCIAYASLRHYHGEPLSVFNYTEFSVLHHPTYFAMYLGFAVSLCFEKLALQQGHSTIWTWVKIAFILMVIILLSSRAGMLALGAIVFVWTLYFFKIRHWKKAMGIAGISLVILSLSSLTSPKALIRLKSAQSAIDITKLDKENKASEVQRMFVWKTSLEAFRDHFWLGTGTGDLRDLLNQKYKDAGLEFAAEKGLNAHNQFLEAGIRVGVLGVISLTLMLLIPIVVAWKRGQMIYITFIIIIGLNFMSESILERQAGVSFYVLFNSLLYFNKPAS